MLSHTKFWVGLSVMTLMGCQATQTSNNPVVKKTAPCWLQNPVVEDQIGFIGTAAPYSATKNGSIVASRQRAAALLANFHGLPNLDKQIKSLSIEQKHLVLESGKKIYFSDPFITSDTLYTYVSTHPIKARQACEAVTCNFTLCEPKWLCNGDNSIIGASYYTAFSHQQLPMTAVNAQALAGYLTQARVNIQERYAESYSADQHRTHFSRQGEVNGSDYQLPLIMTNSCQYGSTLFANYRMREYQQEKVTRQSWREVHQYQGRSVVMGNFGEDGTIAPDNLISSAIKFAIRDALVELAKNKGITVSATSTLLNQGGRFYLSDTHFDVKQVVSGQLLDLQVQYKNGFPVVYVWLLEGHA
ncbi:hypothetical protein [Pseudoalteromonas luteoviolacea]|uniref:hypothetical protein n=1 Tax=Pseudoalteromonas luteoviolacea TaxID=43657 RepID=UPI001B36454C|nr:hypothetical protein [Pseudoalteromonas luteoviolacea]MBQ4835967.1 hypothetical protein [Pseudoalteromonas luteoviolacea]